MAPARELVGAYVRRAVDAPTVRGAIAASLGVASSDVVADDDTTADPVAFVEVVREAGEFPTRISAFVDPPRAPGYGGKPALLGELARRLDSSLLYDDGASAVPYRWVRVDPDGARYEVFEVPDADELRLDPGQGERRLDHASAR